MEVPQSIKTEPQKLSEFKKTDRGSFMEIKFPPQNTAHLNEVPIILEGMKGLMTIMSSQPKFVLTLCSVDNANQFGEFNDEYRKAIGDPPPARITTVGEYPASIAFIAVTPKSEDVTLTVEPTPSTDEAPSVGDRPYSQGMLVKAEHKDGTKSHYVYTSGQMAFKPDTGEFVEGELEDQINLTWDNVGAILKAGETSFENLTKLHVVVTSEDDIARTEEIIKEKLNGRECEIEIQTAGLVVPGGKVEIRAEASSSQPLEGVVQ